MCTKLIILPFILLNLSIACLCGASEEIVAECPPLVFNSGDAQVHLLELYTSEGCSSCPPAEKWFGKLEQDPRLWRTVIPIAFHVNYWDYIGWRDPFAVKEYSDRQRKYAESWENGRVYTPGFVLDGEEWRGWFTKQPLSTDYINQIGTLKITIVANRADIEFTPLLKLPSALILNLAILGFDLTSDIAAGENRGRKLQHDFVAVGYKQDSLRIVNGVYRHETDLPVVRHNSAGKLAVAGWISKTDTPRPIQSVGGWLTR